MSILRCPVCGSPLDRKEKGYACACGHGFDLSREGYVNLLAGSHKPGSLLGDNRDMAKSRRDFLSKGYYAALSGAVGDCLENAGYRDADVLDICCGEGYYTAELAKRFPFRFYGFDLSKEMVRLAAKRSGRAEFFVANMAAMPVADGGVDFAFHLFAPFHGPEFYRILKPGGLLLTVIPGEDHLFGLKEVLYDKPYRNEESPPQADGLRLTDRRKVRETLTLTDGGDILSLLKMTPYFYHTPSAGIERLAALSSLTTPLEFLLLLYQKTEK